MSCRPPGGKVVMPKTVRSAPPRARVMTHCTAMFIQPSSALWSSAGETSATRTFCGCSSTIGRSTRPPCLLPGNWFRRPHGPPSEVVVVDVVLGEDQWFAHVDDMVGDRERAEPARFQ